MSAALKAHAARRFASWRGQAPAGTVFAPGRVNLIGEHLDYNDGVVLPMPIREGTAVAFAPRGDGRVVVRADDLDGADEFALAAPTGEGDWRAYVRGMAVELGARVPGLGGAGLGGADLLIIGNLPRGAGLSSSASLCVAVGRALLAAGGLEADPVTLARAAQAAENNHAGVACGIMDQMAVAAGRAGHAMRLDCRDLSFTHHPLPADWTVLLVDSGINRALADGEFNRRRAECEAAAGLLGVSALRDASVARLAALPAGSTQQRRATHVVTELARVDAAVAALARADLAAMGAILSAGQASLARDFDVSLPAIDALAAAITARLSGAGAARLTGAGFGGALVVVTRRGLQDAVAAAAGRDVLTAF